MYALQVYHTAPLPGPLPQEATEELVKAHFSQWGTVTDVYFPKNKHTFRRRPFCFVTFVTLEAAQRALAESPMNICGKERGGGCGGRPAGLRLAGGLWPFQQGSAVQYKQEWQHARPEALTLAL